MGIRAMFSGVSGLLAHSTWLDVIGNNVSNTNTVAYKASRVMFADQISQTLKGATPDTGSYGGVNAVQVGLGTRVASIQTLFTQGVIQSTGNSTDIAISGSGFLMSKVGSQTLLTRAGNLTLDGEGNLVDQNGGLIQGWNATTTYGRHLIDSNPLNVTDASLKLDTTTQIQTVHITRDMVIPPKATSVLQLSGNLDSFQQANKDGGILNVIDLAGNAQLPWAMNPNLNGMTVDNALLVTTAGSSIHQIDNLQDPAMTTNPAEDAVLLRLGLKTTQTLQVTVPALFGGVSLATAQGNASNAWQQSPPLPPAHSINQVVYDSLGNERNITIQFYQCNDLGTAVPPVNTSPMNQVMYAWYAFDTTGGAAVSNTTLVAGTGIYEGDLGTGVAYNRGIAGSTYWGDFIWFNTDGSLGNTGGQGTPAGGAAQTRPHIYLPPIQETDTGVVPASPIPSIGAEIADIVLDFGTCGILGVGKRDGLYSDAEGSYEIVNGVNTYIPDSTAYGKYQNGYTDGLLSSLTFDTEGKILGTFTNQQTIAIGQIAVAMPNNPEGLAKVGANYYNQTANSGPLYIGKFGTDGTGTIVGNSLESSNVDLTVELSNMIIAQRGFEVNARVIAVTNSTMQTTVQLGQGG
jgi:flagellar hook protein FlgE